jgi:23S rRNA pseudouridine1911/1915/1917 synthase
VTGRCLWKEAENSKILIVHRIDRETSGLLLFAKSEKIKNAIQETWLATITERVYVAVVEGRVKKAVTNYQMVKSNQNYSLLELSLETGRRHQIRVHMQDIGHPIVGDKKYGSGNKSLKRLDLHAQVLAFIHSVSTPTYRFETAVPGKFFRLLE